MKVLRFIIFSFASMFVTSCDNIDFEDRFDEPITTDKGKNVLIEDYTGQKCSNCPLAHVEIEKLQKTYGKERIIAVAIHGGPQAVDTGNSKVTGLANEESKEYNRRLGTFSYPKGVIDRASGLKDIEKWNSMVVSRFSIRPKLKLSINNIKVNESTRQLSFSCDVESMVSLNGFLQLWLTESDIVAPQTLPAVWGGGHKQDYVHNHVFRAAVNGMEGEQLSLSESHTEAKEYVFNLKEDWDIQNMALVMFFHNETDGVIQVIDTPVIPNKTKN